MLLLDIAIMASNPARPAMVSSKAESAIGMLQ
jgi:hypothetical protein